jgi:hypothetical protein
MIHHVAENVIFFLKKRLSPTRRRLIVPKTDSPTNVWMGGAMGHPSMSQNHGLLGIIQNLCAE